MFVITALSSGFPLVLKNPLNASSSPSAALAMRSANAPKIIPTSLDFGILMNVIGFPLSSNSPNLLGMQK